MSKKAYDQMNTIGDNSPQTVLHKSTQTPSLHISWARHQDEVEEAQRLRYKVFVEELGAHLPKAKDGLDQDLFDPWCEHLIVRDEETLRVVGTYRVLTPHQARKLGSLYSETEFDLTRLAHLRPKMIELGRSCVHQDYRTGSVIMALWGGIGRFMQSGGYESILGCASVSMADGGHYAASLHHQFCEKNLANVEYRVFPRLALPIESLNQHLEVEAPPLVKGYLRLGAKICGAPAWDPDFNTADFLTLLRLPDLHPRYARHFLGEHPG